MNISGADAALVATLHTVIVYRGPGSWKRNAYWDEYVVTITNPGRESVTLSQAELIDWQDQVVIAGDDPWKLEKESKEWKKGLHKAGLDTLVHIGAVIGVAGVIETAAISSGSIVLGGATVVALPIYAVGAIVTNVSSRRQVATEFNKRRLVLPLTLAPGETRSGSLFFRISPSPKTLTLLGTSEGKQVRVVIGLESLAGLHLKKEGG